MSETGPRALARVALLRRAERVIAGARSEGPSVVVKKISARRSRLGVKDLVTYVARLDPAERMTLDAPVLPASSGGEAAERAGWNDASVVRDPLEPQRSAAAGPDPVRGPGPDPCKPVVRDETAAIVPRDRLMREIDDWDLDSDRENLSRHARSLLDDAGELGGRDIALQLVGDLPIRGRLRNVQAIHLELSLPFGKRARYSQKEVDTLCVVADATIRETFGSWGHRALWALHEEEGRVPHVHVVVRAMNDDGERLDLDREALDGLRHVFARNARAMGLAVTEARLTDRDDVVERVIDGTIARRDVRRLLSAKTDLPTRVAQRVPGWFASHGTEFVARLERDPERNRREQRSDLPAMSGPSAAGGAVAGPEAARRAELERLLRIYRIYRDADATHRAVERFAAMEREDARFARWCLPRQPVVFGEIGPGAADLKALKRVVRSFPVAENARRGDRRTAPRGRDAIPDGAPLGAREKHRFLMKVSADRVAMARRIEQLDPGDGVGSIEAEALREYARRRRAVAEKILAGAPRQPADRTASAPPRRRDTRDQER